MDKDLAEGVKLETVFSGITDMRDRAYLINFARVLIQADGEPCDDEKKAIDYICQYHSDKLETSVQLAASELEAAALNNAYKAKLKLQAVEDFSLHPWYNSLFDFY